MLEMLTIGYWIKTILIYAVLYAIPSFFLALLILKVFKIDKYWLIPIWVLITINLFWVIDIVLSFLILIYVFVSL